MIVVAHLATGALAGSAVRSRGAAVAVGLAAHVLGDVIPHRDVGSRAFEVASGLGVLAALGRIFGPFDRVTLGAAAAAAPDLEHVLPVPRPGGAALFPSHRWSSLHHGGGFPVRAQLLGAGIVLAAIVRARRQGTASR